MPSETEKTKIAPDDNEAADHGHNPAKRFKNNLVEKLKKDVENLKTSENYSQSNLFRLQVT